MIKKKIKKIFKNNNLYKTKKKNIRKKNKILLSINKEEEENE